MYYLSLHGLSDTVYVFTDKAHTCQ